MTDSRRIAGLLGPMLMAFAVSEPMNLRIWSDSPASVTYLDGTLVLLAGIAVVRAHNRWVRGWPVLVTLTGWVLVVGGLYRMFFPAAPQAPDSPATYVGFALLLLFGVFLSYKAYLSRA